MPRSRSRGVAGVEIRVISVFLDEQPVQIPERRTPDFSATMHFGVSRTVVILVGERIDAHVEAVGIPPNAAAGVGLADDVGADAISGVHSISGLLGEHRGPPVAPAFAHGAGLKRGERAGVGRTTGQAVGHPVAIFVHHNRGIKIAVAIGRG